MYRPVEKKYSAFKAVSGIVLLVVMSLDAYGTPQIPDILIYKGRQYPLYTDVLANYFAKYPEKNPKKEEYRCSAAWDGYRAAFEIIEVKLFLKDITDEPCGPSGPGGPSGRSAMKKVVPDGKPLFVDWYTGILLSMDGYNSENPYSLESFDGFTSYSLFEIDNGLLRRVKHFDNKQYRDYRRRHFQAYQKTDEYSNEIKKRIEKSKVTKEMADADIEFWTFFRAKRFLID